MTITESDVYWIIYDWMDDRLHILRTFQLLLNKLEGEDNDQ